MTLNIVSSSAVRTILADVPKEHSNLRLPDGRRVVDVPHHEFFNELDRLKIENFNHSMPWRSGVELYAQHLDAIAKAGADAAVDAWLAKNRTQV